MVLASFLIPPFVGAIGWILLGGPNAGWINKAWMAVTGASSGPFNVFTFSGLALVTALYSFPLIYVFTKSALDLISTEMEEAAAILGAGPVQITLRVTLPLALPAILGSLFLVFLEALGLYGTPALIAIPAGFNVVTTQLAAFFENPVRVEVAAAFSMPMVGITIVLLWIQRRLLARKSYVTVGGKGGHREPIELGALALGAVRLCHADRGDVRVPAAVHHPADGAEQSLGAADVGGEFHASAIFARCCWIRSRCGRRCSTPSNMPSSPPRSAPFSVLPSPTSRSAGCCRSRPGWPASRWRRSPCPASCWRSAFTPPMRRRHSRCMGCGALVVIAFVTRFLPIAFTNSNSAIQGLHPELEEAVRIAGGDQARALWLVVLPLLKKSLFGSWLLIFIIGTRELSTAMFLSGPQTRVVSVLTLELSEQGQYEMLSAISVLLLTVTGIVTLLGTIVLGRDFMLRRN